MTDVGHKVRCESQQEIRKLPAGCGYQGYEFGAGYLDSECYGGQLYRMDYSYSVGIVYGQIGHIPCPLCRTKAAVAKMAARSLPYRPHMRNRKLNYNRARRRLRFFLCRRVELGVGMPTRKDENHE